MSGQKMNIDQFTNRIQVTQWSPVGLHLHVFQFEFSVMISNIFSELKENNFR